MALGLTMRARSAWEASPRSLVPAGGGGANYLKGKAVPRPLTDRAPPTDKQLKIGGGRGIITMKPAISSGMYIVPPGVRFGFRAVAARTCYGPTFY